jgi:hypothetical protein
MFYKVTGKTGAIVDRTELLRTDSSNASYDTVAAQETFAFILDAFVRVNTLESITFVVSRDFVGEHIVGSSYTCHCFTQLREIPSSLMLPQLDRNARPINVVDVFWRRGGRTDQEFMRAFDGYFEEVWPAFNDRAHLFDAVGELMVCRHQLAHWLCDGAVVDLALGLAEFKSGNLGSQRLHSQSSLQNLKVTHAANL